MLSWWRHAPPSSLLSWGDLLPFPLLCFPLVYHTSGCWVSWAASFSCFWAITSIHGFAYTHADSPALIFSSSSSQPDDFTSYLIDPVNPTCQNSRFFLPPKPAPLLSDGATTCPHYINLWSSWTPPSLSPLTSSPLPHPDYSSNKVYLQTVLFLPSPLPLLCFKLSAISSSSLVFSRHIASSKPFCILPPYCAFENPHGIVLHLTKTLSSSFPLHLG